LLHQRFRDPRHEQTSLITGGMWQLSGKPNQ
jgi:hypothetical protein